MRWIEAMFAAIISVVSSLRASHHHDRLVAGLLEPAEQHDLDEAADMKRGRGGVKSDIARHDPGTGERIQRFRVGDLVNIAALGEQAEKIGLIFGHGGGRLARGSLDG
jgi:hypothetical protein